MLCSSCSKESSTLITVVDIKQKQKKYLCQDCFLKMSQGETNLEELDNLIKQVEDLIEQNRRLVENYIQPDISGLPENLASVVMTPEKLLKLSTGLLEKYKKEREEILDKMEEVDRLRYHLKKALDKEDYEHAAVLRDKISKINRHYFDTMFGKTNEDE